MDMVKSTPECRKVRRKYRFLISLCVLIMRISNLLPVNVGLRAC